LLQNGIAGDIIGIGVGGIAAPIGGVGGRRPISRPRESYQDWVVRAEDETEPVDGSTL
jgi:hypothetical protein